MQFYTLAFFISLVVGSASAVPVRVVPPSPNVNQCGGELYDGSTECPAGFSCVPYNRFFHGCVDDTPSYTILPEPEEPAVTIMPVPNETEPEPDRMSILPYPAIPGPEEPIVTIFPVDH
ncbi:hypothetical protein FA15DRAFT_706179 [Coprinopsis marcescibilis]|uniref:CBM1 domain-containing protein n=1 Tax=Coprinopsis marcescibilis TaxID=230819 RepID=A0A5C3KS15_COPMA|nr:hypothetical protein FA15DRAFT_706179 [Coprinopsis marcescibilis]